MAGESCGLGPQWGHRKELPGERGLGLCGLSALGSPLYPEPAWITVLTTAGLAESVCCAL